MAFRGKFEAESRGQPAGALGFQDLQGVTMVRSRSVVPVTASTIVSVTVVIPVAPVWSVVAVVITSPVSIPVTIIGAPIVVWTGSVVGRSIKNRNRDWQTKRKANPCAGRRFSDKRQSRDDRQEDNELLHNYIGRK